MFSSYSLHFKFNWSLLKLSLMRLLLDLEMSMVDSCPMLFQNLETI